ncbi:MAG: gamma-glutamyltransferase [Gemmatales bacterium]|nr:gamma-glutamyltransferase [Gemmatales bacterium]MDW8385981.1 gamma-glutamyltransferase [Gemmatales bacterium]
MIERCCVYVLAGFLSVMLFFAEAYPDPAGELTEPPEPGQIPVYQPKAVLARNGMVSAAHPLAARIGVEILRQGGNAVDAMVAVQMALNVVEPQSSGIGGGCFILYYEAAQRRITCLDGREEVPAAARRADFLDSQGRVVDDDLTGGAPVGVPGTVAAMWEAHRRWGKLSWPKVLEPAIRLAEDGIGITPRLRQSIALNRSRFLRFPTSRRIFLKPDGSVPEIGEVLRQHDLARTLRLLSQHGPAVFYEGEIARDIVRTVQNASYRPGKLSLEDLKRYRVVERDPIRFSYRGHEIVSVPPPSSGGITLGLMLGILEPTDLASCKPGSVEEVELLARAGAASFADRNAYLGDQDWNPDIPMRRLLEPTYVRQRAKIALNHKSGRPFEPGRLIEGHFQASENPREGHDTTHFSIVDNQRNVIACTTTIEHGMGCALVVEGRGFLLNNELTDFDLDRESGPNALDPTPRPRRTALDAPDSIGGKRPRSSMTPVIVFRDGEPYVSVGSPGGVQIIGIVGQILVNLLDHKMDMQQAINAPRLSSRNGPLELEALYPQRANLVRELERRGWRIEPLRPLYDVWGGAHGIRINSDGTLEGGADPRREGAVRGW